jgi:hypothetical protein
MGLGDAFMIGVGGGIVISAIFALWLAHVDG